MFYALSEDAPVSKKGGKSTKSVLKRRFVCSPTL
jgi:hypothetical protein